MPMWQSQGIQSKAFRSRPVRLACSLNSQFRVGERAYGFGMKHLAFKDVHTSDVAISPWRMGLLATACGLRKQLHGETESPSCEAPRFHAPHFACLCFAMPCLSFSFLVEFVSI